ncbi:MAG: VOC family protein [Vulcanimicrobiaceae bacterium]
MATSGPFVRLDHLQLAIPADGERRARTFYVDIIGLQETPKPEELAKRGGLWLRSGEIRVHLGIDTDFQPATKAHPAFRCADYDGLLARFATRSIAVVHDELPFDGKRHCYVLDPFGNRIELIEN